LKMVPEPIIYKLGFLYSPCLLSQIMLRLLCQPFSLKQVRK